MKPYLTMQDELRQLQETEETKPADGKKTKMNENVCTRLHHLKSYHGR